MEVEETSSWKIVEATDQRLRRSKRKRASTSTAKTSKSATDSSNDSTPQNELLPPKKRARWQPKLGRLAGIMNMPMDVLYEIFGHLKPLDLLHLTRTTKEFRELLLNRSSISIWKSAFEHVSGLPPCPSFMSEPKYAHLVFDAYCHVCLATNIRTVDWRLCIRLCSKCMKSNLLETYSVGVEPWQELIPRRFGKRGQSAYCLKDVNDMRERMNALIDEKAREAFIQERLNLVREISKHAYLCEQWAADQARDRSEQLEDARRARREAIIKKLTELGWGDEIAQILPRDDLSLHRLVKQPHRLTERIWTNIKPEMEKYMQEMKAKRLEREFKALIISRKQVAVGVFREYKIARLPWTDVMPEPADFCSFPAIHDLLHKPADVTVDASAFQGTVPSIDGMVTAWRDDIYNGLKTHMRNKDDEGYFVTEDPEDGPVYIKKSNKHLSEAELEHKITLATTVFKCTTCSSHSSFFGYNDYGLPDFSTASSSLYFLCHGRSDPSEPLFYPHVLGHRCLTKGSFLSPPSITDPTMGLQNYGGTRQKWTCASLRVDGKAGRAAEALVELCGMDPKTTTAVQMDELSARFACKDCLEYTAESTDKASADVMEWRAAIKHHLTRHRKAQTLPWQRIEGEHLAQTLEKELSQYNASLSDSAVHTGRLSPQYAVWLCAHCLDLRSEREPMQFGRVKEHIRSAHQIQSPDENRDYYKSYEACRLAVPPVTVKIEIPATRPSDYATRSRFNDTNSDGLYEPYDYEPYEAYGGYDSDSDDGWPFW